MRDKPNLDMLRSIAIILVLFDHTLLAVNTTRIPSRIPIWTGLFGVYLFFVHTCLVLMWSLERKPHTLDFYIRRAFRIYPLAVVAILCVVVFDLPFSTVPGHLFVHYHPNLKGVLSNLLLIQNIAWGGGLTIAVLWSLPLEVQMYILLPILYFFVREESRLWPLLLIWALACGLAWHALPAGNNFATVIPCFLPGIMAYVLFGRVRPRLPAWLFPPFVFVLTLIFLHFSAVVASWPVCLALGLGIPLFHQIGSSLLKRLTHEIAKYSYGLYLGHMFALGIAFALLKGHSLTLQLPLAITLMIVFSVVGNHAIEKPMIDFGSKLAARAERRYEQHHRPGAGERV